jgi:hypothetical protein
MIKNKRKHNLMNIIINNPILIINYLLINFYNLKLIISILLKIHQILIINLMLF